MPLKMRRTCKILSAFLGSFLILIIILGYSQYLTLKKTFIFRISDRATALIGQKVEIGDIYLDPRAGITVAGIIIRNPESSIQGALLKIAKVRLDMRYRELFRGRFSFRTIEIVSPEISLISAEGKLNISEAFRTFFSKQGTVEYLIDNIVIRNAGFSFNNEPLYRVADMNLSIKDISSVKEMKSSFEASLSFLDRNKMNVEGWAYLKDKAHKFSISARAVDIDLALLREHFGKFGIELDKSRAGITIQAEGDTDQGIKIKTEAGLKSRGLFVFNKVTTNSLSLTAEAFLDTKKESLTISKSVFSSGDSSSIQANGVLHGIFGKPSYEAELRVNRFDLSVFDFRKGLKVSGIITSEPIQVIGTLSSDMPKVTGKMTISNGAFGMAKADIQGLNAEIGFNKDLSVRIGTTARILKAGDAILRQPVDMTLSVEGSGKAGKIMIKSELSLSGIDMGLKGKVVRAAQFKAAYDGTIEGRALSGNASLEAKDLAYDAYKTKDFRTDLSIDYNNRSVTLSNINTVSDIFSMAADRISVTLPDYRGKIVGSAKNLNASYPDRKTALKGLDCTVSMSGSEGDLSGELSFAAQQILFHDINAGSVTGTGSIANGEFRLDIPSARLFEGSIRISAKGKSANSPFPLTVALEGNNINVRPLSEAAKSFFKTPYAASGRAESLSFEGEVVATGNITGRASLRGKNFSIINAGGKAMFKDAAVGADIVFRGKDMDIKAGTSAAGLTMTMSGTAEYIFEDYRALQMSFQMPEAKISDIRNAFWDIVPDRLLYVGMNGSIATNLLATYRKGILSADGGVLLQDITIVGENSEYSIGPINGMVPIHFTSAGNESISLSIPSFERNDFEEQKKAYAETKQFSGNEIRVGSIRYGFKLLEDLSLWVEQKDSSLKINHFSAKMFGGKVNGTGFADLSDGLSYRAGLIADGVSLTQLCEEIPPIKGYISGRIDGIAAIKGSGAGLANIIGKADFWTFSAEGEQTRISKEFLEKIGGPQLRAYLGERKFNRGIMGLYIQNGFIIFRELEISNRNLLGISDLSVKVAPLNNRIAIDHLMWTITEAAQRAKKE